MFNPNDLTSMLNSLQNSIKDLEAKQESETYTAKSGGGLVSVTINGKGEVVDLNIDKSLLDDVESLQILLIGAINEAYKNIEDKKKSSAMELFGDLSPFGK